MEIAKSRQEFWPAVFAHIEVKHVETPAKRKVYDAPSKLAASPGHLHVFEEWFMRSCPPLCSCSVQVVLHSDSSASDSQSLPLSIWLVVAFPRWGVVSSLVSVYMELYLRTSASALRILVASHEDRRPRFRMYS